jgi:hypothetical protein
VSATPVPATTTDDGGVAETQTEQQAAEDSAGEQTSEAAEGAEIVGADAQ